MRFIGPVGQSVLRSATLLDAFNTFEDHLSRWMDGKQFWIEPAGRNVWLCNQARVGMEDLQEQANQCSIMTLISLIREVAGPTWVPLKIRLHQPKDQSRSSFPLLAETEVEPAECGIAILFPTEFLSRKLPKLQVTPSALPGPQAGPQQIIPALEQTLPDQLAFIGFPTIEQTAEISGFSARNLQRKLSEDGLTYQRLSDRIRFQVAHDRLESDPLLSIGELSFELGYASPSSFIRAFKRVAGMTPVTYRETLIR